MAHCPDCGESVDELEWDKEIVGGIGHAWLCPACGAILGTVSQ